MERDRGLGRPDQKSRAQKNAQSKDQAKPQQESTGGKPVLSPVEQKTSGKLSLTPEGEKKIENVSRLLEQRGAVFECTIPRVIPSPYDLRRMLRHGDIREEQAQEAEREWRENLRTWDRQRLEKAIYSLEESRERSARQNRQEAVRDIEYELKTLREELRQRE